MTRDNNATDRLDEPHLDEGVESMLLRRARDGEVSRVRDLYMWRPPGGCLRSHCHEPLEILVVLGLLAEADPDPAADARPVVLTDAGRSRLAQITPPDADEITGVIVLGCCGHHRDIRAGDAGIWISLCPNCDKPDNDDFRG